MSLPLDAQPLPYAPPEAPDFGAFLLRLLGVYLVATHLIDAASLTASLVGGTLTANYQIQLSDYAIFGLPPLIGIGGGVALILFAHPIARLCRLSAPWPRGVHITPAAAVAVAVIGLVWFLLGAADLLSALIGYIAVQQTVFPGGGTTLYTPYSYRTDAAYHFEWIDLVPDYVELALGLFLMLWSRRIIRWLGLTGRDDLSS